MIDKERNKDREVYSFVVNDIVETKEVEKSINENGDEVSTSKIVKKEVPKTIVLIKPTRKQKDEGDLQKNIKFSECIKRGILSKAMVLKKYNDAGGILSEEEQREHIKKYEKHKDLEEKAVKLNIELINLQNKKKKTEEEKLKIEKLKVENEKVGSEIISITRDIIETESACSAVYENTADMISIKHEILYYVLTITHFIYEKNGKEYCTEFFKGIDFDDKLERFNQNDEETDFELQVFKKLSLFVTSYVTGSASSKEDFDKLNKDIENGLI